MKITLNDQLSPSTFVPWGKLRERGSQEPQTPEQQVANFAAGNFVKGTWDREKQLYMYNSRFVSAFIPEDAEALHLGYVGLLSFAYSRHEKVRVSPHDLWYIVLTEIAKIVNDHSDKFRSLFTRSAEKVGIVVETDDVTKIDPLKIIEKLNTLSPTDPEIFMPSFSTATPEYNIAAAAAFADMVQSYYSYMTMMCGIPEIEVTGTVEDWTNSTRHVLAIRKQFASIDLPGLSDYLNRVGGIFGKIMIQVQDPEHPDLDFWKGIYTHKNVGSGGDLDVDGWIVDLFFNHKSRRLESFMSTYGSFPYKNLETGREFKAYYGAFAQQRSPEGFVYSGYGSFVIEQVEEFGVSRGW